MVMVRPRAELGSLRFSRLEKERLLIALLFSLFAHLGVWGGYEAGKKTGLWNKLHWPVRHHVQSDSGQTRRANPIRPFLWTCPSLRRAAKQAKYYSDKNSQAANPEPTIESNQPKINGTQTRGPENRGHTQAGQSQTGPADTAAARRRTQAGGTNAGQHRCNPGAAEKAKPEDTPRPTKTGPPEKRPRTLREALAQRPTGWPARKCSRRAACPGAG